MDPDTIYEEETVELNTESDGKEQNTDSEAEMNEVVVGEEEEVTEQHLDEVLIMDSGSARKMSEAKGSQQKIVIKGGQTIISKPGGGYTVRRDGGDFKNLVLPRTSGLSLKQQTIKVLPIPKAVPIQNFKNIKVTSNVPGQLISHQTVPIKRKLEGSPMVVRLDKRMRLPTPQQSPVVAQKQVRIIRHVGMQTEVSGDIMEQYQQIIEEDQQKIAILEDQIKKLKYTPEMFENDDKRTEYFTGLDTFVTMITLFNTCEADLPATNTLTKFEIFILTLLKLRLKLPLPFLGYLFGVSPKAATYFYNECLGVLHTSLREVFSESIEMVEAK